MHRHYLVTTTLARTSFYTSGTSTTQLAGASFQVSDVRRHLSGGAGIGDSLTRRGIMTVSAVNGSNGVDGAHEQNAWQQPGPAAFDFRSDVVTTPTPSMLAAIEKTTLLDDVFAEDPTTNALEAYMAELTEHEGALLVLSGTMGNQVALRSHLKQPPHAVLCDHRAHIISYEAGGVASLSQAMVKPVVPANGNHLTLEDVRKNVILGEDDVHACPTRVISLENTLGGTIMPLDEARRIAAFAREHDIKLHLDGARIWEAVVAGAGSLPEYTRLFDSVSLCFSKGLGAPIGSILVGDRKFIKHARWIRKSIGGGLRQAGVVSAAARVAVDETFGRGPHGEGGKLRRSHDNARRVQHKWLSLGGTVDKPVETNMVWLNLESLGMSNADFAEAGKKVGLRVMSGRLVVHYQISDEALARLENLLDETVSSKKNGTSTVAAGRRTYGS